MRQRAGVLQPLLILMAACVPIAAQAPGGTPFRIERLDPALDAIVSPDARLEELASGFALTEGPVWVGEGEQGYLLFSDNAGNVIYKWERGKPLVAFLEKSGFTGTDNSKIGAQTVAGRVAILNQTLARRLFGDDNPIGRRVAWTGQVLSVIGMKEDYWRDVIGVVSDTRDNGPNAPAPPVLYMPLAQNDVAYFPGAFVIHGDAAPQLGQRRTHHCGHNAVRKVVRRPWQRGVRAHAPGVRPGIVVADPLEVLRQQQGDGGVAVGHP